LKKITLLFVILALFTVITINSTAQETEEIREEDLLFEEEGEPAPEGTAENLNAFTAWDFVRMILILVAVIAVIYIIFFFLKRSGKTNFQENNLFRIISSVSLSGNRALHLVKVGNQLFLVGSGENSVSLVSEITDKESVDEIQLKLSNISSENKKSFKALFSGMFGNTSGQKKTSVFMDSIDNIKKQRERLNKF